MSKTTSSIIMEESGDEEKALWPGLRCCRKTELEVEKQRVRGVSRGWVIILNALLTVLSGRKGGLFVCD